MNELRKQVRNIVTNVIREYEEVLTDAEKTGEGINLMGLNSKCMSHIDKLDLYLSEFEARRTKKKRFF